MTTYISNIYSLIESHKKHFPTQHRYNAIKCLIEDYINFGLYDRAIKKQKERFCLSKNLIKEYSNSDIFVNYGKYDLFKALNIKLNENSISDITSDILNPLKSPFGKRVITYILIQSNKKHISKILQNTNDKYIKVKREQAGDNSRIDIRIFTTNPLKENLIIDFEIKINHGEETFINDEYQTIREWNDLYIFSQKADVPLENTIAFFVTPSGKSAKCKNFIPLSWHNLNQIICEVLDERIESDKLDTDAIGTLKHFFKSKWLF